MPALTLLTTRWLLALGAARRRDERGDVPGWVLVTVMTAGLVAVIWGVADDQLSHAAQRTQLRALRPQMSGTRRRGQHGAAVVDFVLVLVVLVPLFLGILQLALVLMVRNTLASAASEGARYAATLDRGPSDGVARTRQQIDGAISGRFARDVDATTVSIDGAPAVRVTVHAEVPALGLGGPAVSIDVSAHAVEEQAMSRRRRGESGSALVELTWLGILLLVPVIWIVLSASEVQRGAFATSAAARAAGRAYALAPTDAEGHARAEAAARQALADQGADGQSLTLSVSCRPAPGDCHRAGSVITVQIRSGVELPLLPSVLGGGAPSFRLDASHTVPIGQFRDEP